FLDNKFYDSLVNDLKVNFDEKAPVTEPKDDEISVNGTTFSLKPEQIFLGLEASDKFEAIRFAGEQLVKAGFVQPSYVDAMFEREKLVSTYLGEGVAVPHGTIEAKDAVLKTGVVVCQYPAGVRFTDDEDGVAKLVIGIAARNNEHIQVVSAITNALDSEEAIALLTSTNDVNKVLELLKA
ncbi:MAG: PTS sugar transporter subunit IIA, partial [[Actinobacillus] rossii]|nr:PTS sugar transporter subunit IIA [[Actinobacillus] rossii]